MRDSRGWDWRITAPVKLFHCRALSPARGIGWTSEVSEMEEVVGAYSLDIFYFLDMTEYIFDHMKTLFFLFLCQASYGIKVLKYLAVSFSLF